MQQNYDQFIKKGNELMKKGQKKAKGSFFGNIVSNKQERAAEAQSVFQDAATQYKLGQDWENAAQAMLQCINCDLAQGGNESADLYREVAQMMKRSGNQEFVNMYDKAGEMYCSQGRISEAARLKKQLAESYESDMSYDLAIKFYKDAAILYKTENEDASDYYKMILKVADLSIHSIDIDYKDCIRQYDEVIKKYLQNNLLAPSTKKLYICVICLYLASEDPTSAKISLDRYVDEYPQFDNTRQSKFLYDIIESFETGDADQFSVHCATYNKIIPLSKWETSILSRIKEKIPQQQSGANILGETGIQQEQQPQENVPSQNVDVF